MPDSLIVLAAAAQVELIHVSLSRSPTGASGTATAEQGQLGASWLPAWMRACDGLNRIGRGTAPQCAELVWRQLDLATDLSGQSWWGNPRLRRAAVGEIAWTTVTGRWTGSVSSAEAQREWEHSYTITAGIQRRPVLRTPLFGHRHGTQERLAELRRRWEDAWWKWATARELAGGVLSPT